MLKLSQDIPYQSPIDFANFYHDNELFKISFHRTYGDRINGEFDPTLSRYFIQIYKENYLGEYRKICAYIYFYLDFKTKETKYIGTLVDPEYRNLGFASLLTSLWTWICMDNNFYEYMTNKKQRKPFILYLLKLHGFELDDTSYYDTSRNTIYICRHKISQDKCLYFKDQTQAENFKKSKIQLLDNYNVLSSLDDQSIEVLDRVVPSTYYRLQDFNTAYTRSRTILESKNII